MKNLEYLQDQIKYTGFGDSLKDAIASAIEQGDTEIKLDHEVKYGKDTVNAELNFSKSKQSEMYFFNSYKVELQKEGSSEKMEQMFYINKGNNITLKEAYNLMNGRSVNKDLTSKQDQIYNTWLQLDFKQSDDNGNFKMKHYHENYGYDLEGTLSKLQLKELANEDQKSNLIDSLKKGNLQSVTFIKDEQEIKMYIEASPQYKAINVYDASMKRLDSKQSKSEKLEEGVSQENAKQGRKEKQGIDPSEGPEEAKNVKSKKNGHKIG